MYVVNVSPSNGFQKPTLSVMSSEYLVVDQFSPQQLSDPSSIVNTVVWIEELPIESTESVLINRVSELVNEVGGVYNASVVIDISEHGPSIMHEFMKARFSPIGVSLNKQYGDGNGVFTYDKSTVMSFLSICINMGRFKIAPTKDDDGNDYNDSFTELVALFKFQLSDYADQRKKIDALTIEAAIASSRDNIVTSVAIGNYVLTNLIHHRSLPAPDQPSDWDTFGAKLVRK